MSGLDKNIKAKPSENLYQAYRIVRKMRRNFSSIDPARLEITLRKSRRKS